MKSVYLLLLIWAFCAPSISQTTWDSIIREKQTAFPNLASSLYQIGKYATSNPAESLEKAREAGMTDKGGIKILVEVQYGWNPEKTGDFDLSAVPYPEVQGRYRNLTSAWIEPGRLLDLSGTLPAGYLISATNLSHRDREGNTVTNALDHQVNGVTSQGIRIAIIDSGYGSLSAAQTAGTAPAAPVTFDHTGSGSPFDSGNTHGTSRTEIIFEYATGATYFLLKIANTTQLGIAINQAIADGVDIISHSSSYLNQGWADGSGIVCAAVKDASDAGLLYVHGAGNFHRRHWQGTYKDDDGDQWHEFNNLDETNQMTIANGNSVTAHLQWPGNPSTSNDFDLYLFDNATINLLASSTSTGDFESLSWTNNTGGTMNVELAVFRFNSSKTEFELFAPTGNDFQFGQTGGATASPANSLEDFCITLGAVN